jgi:hypothetical protein
MTQDTESKYYDEVRDLLSRRHFITRDVAKALIERFAKSRDRIINPELKDVHKKVGIIPFSEAFNEKAILRILAQRQCIGLRIFLGMKENFEVVFVIVGVDDKGRNMWDSSATVKAAEGKDNGTFEGGDGIAEEGQRCPPWPPSQPQP